MAAVAATAGDELHAQLAEQRVVLEEMQRRGFATPEPFRDFVARHNPRLLNFEHIPRLCPVVDRVVWGDLKRVLIIEPPRYFKALAGDTPIATPDGWRTIGELRSGDEVFAADGTPTRVLAVQHWKQRPVYRVTTDDGHSVVADAAHEWLVRLDRKRGAWSVRETQWLADRSSPRRPLIPQHGALDLPDADLPIPPYTLGAWLGDGSSHYGAITAGDEDRAFLRAQVEADGFTTRMHSCGKVFGVLGLVGRLRRAGLLANKHIPEVYFRASRTQRLALLQGLIDTDGSVNASAHGQVTFSNTNRRLAEQVCELVHTLGVKASISEYRSSLEGRDCGPFYAVTFHMADAARLPRKAQHCRDGVRSPGRFLSFEQAGTADTTCIQVEHPSHLFLAGRALIVTHNSEMFSRLLGAHWARQMPHTYASIISYGADLAWELSEDARNYYIADGGKLRRETGAKKRWRTPRGGGLWAYGVGGALLGRGYTLGIIDDPVDPEKAWSATYQRRFREWYPAKFLSRQEPHARVVVVMQRLGLDDPIDFLFRREIGENTDLAPEHWHVVLLDEIKSDEPLWRSTGPMGLPPTCTLEPDPRPLGQVLAPSRFSVPQVVAMQRAAGPLVTAAQRQGRPMRPTGDFWKKDSFRVYDVLPADAYDAGTDWDTAYTKHDLNSASAYVRSLRGPGKEGQFPIYIEDASWDWREFPKLIEWMRSVAGPHHIESKASGKSSKQALAEEGIVAYEVTVLGDKLARASAVQSVVDNRRVWIKRSLLHTILYGDRQGLLRVSAERLQEEGPDLDLNDAFVQALTRHVGLHERRVIFG